MPLINDMKDFLTLSQDLSSPENRALCEQLVKTIRSEIKQCSSPRELSEVLSEIKPICLRLFASGALDFQMKEGAIYGAIGAAIGGGYGAFFAKNASYLKGVSLGIAVSAAGIKQGIQRDEIRTGKTIKTMLAEQLNYTELGKILEALAEKLERLVALERLQELGGNRAENANNGLRHRMRSSG